MADNTSKSAPADLPTKEETRREIGRRLRPLIEAQAAADAKGVIPGSPPAAHRADSVVEPPKPAEPPKEEPAKAAEGEAKTVPYDRFKEVNDKLKAEREARERFETELKAKADRLAELEQAEKKQRVTELLNGKGKFEPEDILDLIESRAEEMTGSVEQRLAKMERTLVMRQELRDRGLTVEQGAAVEAIGETVAGLSTDELIGLARLRHQSLFPQSDARSFNPAQHASTKPTGGVPQSTKPPDHMEALRGAATHEERMAAASAVIRERFKARGIPIP